MSTAKKTSEQKRDGLRLLAKQRQADRRDGYLCLSDIHSGYYDTDEHVSPWSTSTQNVDDMPWLSTLSVLVCRDLRCP